MSTNARVCEPVGEGAGVWVCDAAARVSNASAAAWAPPLARKPSATRRAPSRLVMARRTWLRSRSAPSFWAGSRVPALATSTRRATSSWSRPNGTTHTGTPAASAFCVAPAPPWVIAQTARSNSGPCEMNLSTRALAGRNVELGCRECRHHLHVLIGQGVERCADKPSVVLELGGGGHEHEWPRDLIQPGRRLARRLPAARADHPDRGRPVRPRILEGLGRHVQQQRGDVEHLLGRLERAGPDRGSGRVEGGETRLVHGAGEQRAQECVTHTTERAARGRQTRTERWDVSRAQRQRVGKPLGPRSRSGFCLGCRAPRHAVDE